MLRVFGGDQEGLENLEYLKYFCSFLKRTELQKNSKDGDKCVCVCPLLVCCLQCVVRKDLGGGLGGSDVCHFCTKRVYVMERLSAEGYFFHRECFRCDVCKCTLRLGGHTFDSQEGELFYGNVN